MYTDEQLHRANLYEMATTQEQDMISIRLELNQQVIRYDNLPYRVELTMFTLSVAIAIH